MRAGMLTIFLQSAGCDGLFVLQALCGAICDFAKVNQVNYLIIPLNTFQQLYSLFNRAEN
jgi:hypothetical protein